MTSDFAAPIFHAATVAIANGDVPDKDFNDTLKIFIPKPVDISSGLPVVIQANDARPLGLKNTDVKTIAAVVNSKVKKRVAETLCEVQQGFLMERNFVNNVIKADAWSRTYALRAVFHLPLLVLFDFAAAFPSIAHDWLITVLQ